MATLLPSRAAVWHPQTLASCCLAPSNPCNPPCLAPSNPCTLKPLYALAGPWPPCCPPELPFGTLKPLLPSRPRKLFLWFPSCFLAPSNPCKVSQRLQARVTMQLAYPCCTVATLPPSLAAPCCSPCCTFQAQKAFSTVPKLPFGTLKPLQGLAAPPSTCHNAASLPLLHRGHPAAQPLAAPSRPRKLFLRFRSCRPSNPCKVSQRLQARVTMQLAYPCWTVATLLPSRAAVWHPQTLARSRSAPSTCHNAASLPLLHRGHPAAQSCWSHRVHSVFRPPPPPKTISPS